MQKTMEEFGLFGKRKNNRRGGTPISEEEEEFSFD